MMFRRSFVDLVLEPSSAELRLYVDFYMATFACLLTGAIAIHDTLYAYRMHGRNKHSDAAVMGGAYNSSTRPWQPIQINVLRLIQSVLQSKAEDIRRAFGDERHTNAKALIAIALAELCGERDTRTLGMRLLTKAADLIGNRLNGGSHRNGVRSVAPILRRRDHS
jgi:hypothetical protein